MIGIYKIQDCSGKLYIGSSVQIEKRLMQHKYALRRNSHKNPILQASFNKYGETYFTFDIVEETLLADLYVTEQKHLDTLFNTFPIDMIYNVCRLVDTPPMISKKYHSEESKRKMSTSAKNRKSTSRVNSSVQHALVGRKQTEEHIKNRSLANTGKTRTEETKKKMSDTHKKRYEKLRGSSKIE